MDTLMNLIAIVGGLGAVWACGYMKGRHDVERQMRGRYFNPTIK